MRDNPTRVCLDTCILLDLRKMAEEAEGDDTGWSDWLQTQEGRRKFDDLRALQYLLWAPDQWDIEFIPNDVAYQELKSNADIYEELMKWSGHDLSRVKKSELFDLRSVQKTLEGSPVFSKPTKKGKIVPLIPDRKDVEQLFHFYLKKNADIFLTTDYKHILVNASILQANYGITVMSPHLLLSKLTGEARPVEFIERILYGVNLCDHPKFFKD